MKPFLAREELLNRGLKIFTPLDFARVFPSPKEQIHYFLETQAKEGLLVRLKRGLYALKTDLPSGEEIANALYRPSYISLEYALAKYGIIPESPYNITSVTTNPTRIFTSLNQTYSYYTIKQKAYSGYYLNIEGEKNVLIAQPEKALADFLYFTSIGQRSLNDRIKIANLDHNKLKKYAKFFGRGKVLKLAEGLL
jgi:predicted transcriptional regulator of viral defense system